MVNLLFGLRPALTSIVAVSSLLLTATFAGGEVLQPKENLTVNPKLSTDDDEATNVSGAACFIVAGERKSCLLIGDEVKYGRFFSIDGKILVPGQRIFLLPERDSNGQKFKETDAEGIAFAKNFFYVVGSHGLNKDGVKQPSRYFVYRMRIDPVTGRPSDLGSEETASTSVERKTTLDALIAADPGGGSNEGSFTVNNLVGDANIMSGSAHGGDDTLKGGSGSARGGTQNDLFGDANTMSDFAQGGNDTLIGGNVGDLISGLGRGVTNTFYGDAGTMSGSAYGGNNTLIGGISGGTSSETPFTAPRKSWRAPPTRAIIR